MKPFQRIVMKPINSANANFVLSIEAQTQRKTQSNDMVSNCYMSQNGIGYIDPNIYVVFEFKGPDASTSSKVFTSHPNILDIRKVLNKMDAALDDAYTDIDGTLVVKPEYANPYIVDEIGQGYWISFKFVVASSTENGIAQRMKAIEIQLSTSQGFASVLNLREFNSLVAIINDINLPALQWITGLMFLETKESNQGYNQSYNNNNQSYRAQPQTPRYNTQSYQQPQQPVNTGRSTVMPSRAPQPQANSFAEESTPMMPFPTEPYAKQPQQPSASNLPNRSSNTIISNAAVSETDVGNISFDDEDAIDSIFNDQE